MTVYYEWDVEEVANEDLTSCGQDFAKDDVMEHWHQTSFKDCLDFIAKNAPAEGVRYDIVLVRDDDDRRAWAYISDGVNGELPEYCCDANGIEYRKVPKRFHDEVKKNKGVDK